MSNATRQLERIGEGLEQAAQLTRRAGDALEDMSRSLLRAAEQMRTNGGRRTTTHSTTKRPAVSRRGIVAARRTGTRARIPKATRGEPVRVQNVSG